jgi:predicted protein tyrosine phosphatase
MDVLVMSRETAKRWSYHPNDEITGIISITDPDKEKVNFKNGFFDSVLRVSFWDEESEDWGCIDYDSAHDIAVFIDKNKSRLDTLIVQCEAGVSRSAGVAAAILKALTGDDMQIFGNPKYSPNMKCYRMVLNALME